MKDISIQVIKVGTGYQIIVVDDQKAEGNSDGWKCRTEEVPKATKAEMITDVTKRLQAME